MNGKALTILLIEDNLDHAELIQRNLYRNRIANEIIHIEDGETALQFLHEKIQTGESGQDSLPDLILLDLRLPKVDGLQVLKQIKCNSLLNHIPVVVLTTSNSSRDIELAYQHCANSYLIKPVGFEDFMRMVTDLGFYWLVWNQHPRKIGYENERE